MRILHTETLIREKSVLIVAPRTAPPSRKPSNACWISRTCAGISAKPPAPQRRLAALGKPMPDAMQRVFELVTHAR